MPFTGRTQGWSSKSRAPRGHAGTLGHLAPLAVPPGLSPNTGGTSTTAEVRSNPALPEITHQQRFPTGSWWVQLQRGQLFGDPDAARQIAGVAQRRAGLLTQAAASHEDIVFLAAHTSDGHRSGGRLDADSPHPRLAGRLTTRLKMNKTWVQLKRSCRDGASQCSPVPSTYDALRCADPSTPRALCESQKNP